MPEISRFHGIIIRLFYETGRHSLPHFHAAYGQYRASFAIEPPTLLAGTMPRRQQNLILAWTRLHQEELLDNWERAKLQQPLNRIEGLRWENWMDKQGSNNDRLHRVVEFRVTGEYLIAMRFSDETERVIDFEPVLAGPVFGPLTDPQLFARVKLNRDFGTLEWPTGADIDPAVLHDWPDHVEAIVENRKQFSQVAI